LFLNQILEEYKLSNNKNDIINKFIEKLWNSEYIFKKYKKRYKFDVFDDLLDNRKDLIELFNKYNVVEYTVCGSFHKNKKKLESIDYIRIRLNNMYGFLFDKDVYYNRKYYNLLLTPKKEYFKLVNIKKEKGNINDIKFEEVRINIEDALNETELIKQDSINKKYDINFNNYKKLINTYIERIFNNYKSIEEYEKDYKWELKISVDGWSEDNYVIKYFCKSLTGYMRNYVRDVLNKSDQYKECKSCNILFHPTNIKNIYCPDCVIDVRRETKRNTWHKYKIKYKNTRQVNNIKT
jgi:predicted RNA-binding Zn-ribbon protein involved in translation (DUF1610 family)